MSRKHSKEDEIPLTEQKSTILQETKARFDSLLKAALTTHQGDEVIEKKKGKKDQWFGGEGKKLQDRKQFRRRSSKKLSISTQMLVTEEQSSSSSDLDDLDESSKSQHDPMKEDKGVISISSSDELSNPAENTDVIRSPVTKAIVHSVIDSDSVCTSPKRPLPVLPKRQSTRDESRETTSSRVSSPDSVMTAIEAGTPNRSPKSTSSEFSSVSGRRTEEFELKPLKGFSPSYEEIDETHHHDEKFSGSSEGNQKVIENAASYEEILEESSKYNNSEREDNGPGMVYESTPNGNKDNIKKRLKLQKSSQVNVGKHDTNTETSSCERARIHSKQKRHSSQSRKKVKSHKERNLSGAENRYSYERIIGISLHRTDTLKIDSLIKHPMVRVHIIDTLTGEYLKKSQNGRSVSFYQEEPSIDYVQPIMTQPCNFKDPRSLTPVWEETLLFNEDINHILQPNSSTLILFEVLDCVSFDTAVAQYQRLSFESGWHRIAWAFLKPCGPNNILNIDKRRRLQLYKPRNDKSFQGHNVCEKCDVYRWWSKGGWVHYPSTLHVTVHSLSMPSGVSPAVRSYFALQPEEFGADHFDTYDEGTHKLNDHTEDSKSIRSTLTDIKWSRLPSQSCKIPNEKVSNLAGGLQGSFSICFSHRGNYLAIVEDHDRMHSICVYRIPDGSEVVRFQGHPGLVYSLNWSSSDDMLLSASADCTVCIWSLKNQNHSPCQMLPHPSFVYCAVFLPTDMSLATGCRDHVIRIWRQNDPSGSYQLLEELNSHEGYISALCINTDGILFSGDSTGQIKMWQCEESKWSYSRSITVRELQGIVLSHLISHPGGKRLLVLARDSLLRMVDISTGVAIQWFKGALNHRIHSRACITPCGGLIFAPSEDGTFYVWNSDTGMLLASYNALFLTLPGINSGDKLKIKPPLPTSVLSGAVDYHPFEHMAVFAVYGVHAPVVICKFNRDSQGKEIGLQLKAGNQNEEAVSENKIKTLAESAQFLSKVKSHIKNERSVEDGGNNSASGALTLMDSEVSSSRTNKGESQHLCNILKQLDYVLQISRSPRQYSNTEFPQNLPQQDRSLTPDPSHQVCNSPRGITSDVKSEETKSEVAYSVLHSTSAANQPDGSTGQSVRKDASSHQMFVKSPTELQYVMERQPPRPMPRSKKTKPVRSERRKSVADLSTTDTSLLSSDNESSTNPLPTQSKFPQISYVDEKQSKQDVSGKHPSYSKVRVQSQRQNASSFDSDSDI